MNSFLGRNGGNCGVSDVFLVCLVVVTRVIARFAMLVIKENQADTHSADNEEPESLESGGPILGTLKSSRDAFGGTDLQVSATTNCQNEPDGLVRKIGGTHNQSPKHDAEPGEEIQGESFDGLHLADTGKDEEISDFLADFVRDGGDDDGPSKRIRA